MLNRTVTAVLHDAYVFVVILLLFKSSAISATCNAHAGGFLAYLDV